MKIQLNPTGKLTLPEDTIKACMGFLPQYVLGIFGGGNSLRERIEKGSISHSGYDCKWDTDAKINADTGEYISTENTELLPLAQFEHMTDKVFIYECGIVAVFDSKSPEGASCKVA